jgi:hypothetical protein
LNPGSSTMFSSRSGNTGVCMCYDGWCGDPKKGVATFTLSGIAPSPDSGEMREIRAWDSETVELTSKKGAPRTSTPNWYGSADYNLETGLLQSMTAVCERNNLRRRLRIENQEG